jgi:hypothetical protein
VGVGRDPDELTDPQGAVEESLAFQKWDVE